MTFNLLYVNFSSFMDIFNLFENLKFQPSLKDKGCGIYVIFCTKDSKVYIGSSINIHRRWKEHKSRLRKGNHPNIHLQRIHDKYGLEVLIFKVIELTTNLEQREVHFIEFLKSSYEVINIADPAKRCPYVFPDSFRKKRSQIMKGNTISKGYKHSQETCKINSEAHKKLFQSMSEEQKINWLAERRFHLRRATAKITLDIAREIKRRLKNDERPFAIAKSLNLKPYFVINIKAGKTWKDA